MTDSINQAVHFTKMQGLGNDFVIIDALTQNITLSAEHIHRLADRHFGVGCDQVLLVEAPTKTDTDFFYRIYNADGSQVENCGNGARCFAKFVSEQGLTGKKHLLIETVSSQLSIELLDDNWVAVNMGIPELEPQKIPFSASSRQVLYPVQVNDDTIEISAVSMGNPHAVLRVDDVNSAPVDVLGPLLESHAAFPEKVNVGFMAIDTRTSIHLRVFERGVGETLACGTGACAAVVAGRTQGDLDDEVSVSLPGGKLRIRWPGEGQPLIMIGPAENVFEGKIFL